MAAHHAQVECHEIVKQGVRHIVESFFGGSRGLPNPLDFRIETVPHDRVPIVEKWCEDVMLDEMDDPALGREAVEAPPVPADPVQREGEEKLRIALSELGLPSHPSELSKRKPVLQSMTADALAQEKRRVKDKLKQYDAAWEARHGAPPNRREKEPMRPLYTYYKEVKDMLEQRPSEPRETQGGSTPSTCAPQHSVGSPAASPSIGISARTSGHDPSRGGGLANPNYSGTAGGISTAVGSPGVQQLAGGSGAGGTSLSTGASTSNVTSSTSGPSTGSGKNASISSAAAAASGGGATSAGSTGRNNTSSQPNGGPNFAYLVPNSGNGGQRSSTQLQHNQHGSASTEGGFASVTPVASSPESSDSPGVFQYNSAADDAPSVGERRGGRTHLADGATRMSQHLDVYPSRSPEGLVGNRSPGTRTTAGGGNSELIAKKQELQAEKAQIRDRLQKYQDDFFQRNKRKIKYHRDILPIEKDYKDYKAIKRQMAEIDSWMALGSPGTG
ncbi:unnamed protein product [Amoebophrya sp. A25]|nr:unnamed protein product [Amoebophrya sp. A25]|eukprot:GSA25T00007464001.1